MVNRGGQRNPAFASAGGARFVAGPAVFFSFVITAGLERAPACAARAGNSRSSSTGQAQARQVPESKCNSATVKAGNAKGHRSSQRSDAEVFFPVVFPPVVPRCPLWL